MNFGEGRENPDPQSTRRSGGTGEIDFRAVLRRCRASALKRFLKLGPAFLVVFLSVFYLEVGYLLPLGMVGCFGLAFTVISLWSRMLWITKCSRVFHSYPLEFRGPVAKVNRDGDLLFLRFADQSNEATMCAKSPLKSRSWPAGIADGVWFAGDDPFGGAAIVPGSGELLFMQPTAWKLLAEKRKNAGVERNKRARRAWISWRVTFRMRVLGT